MKSAVGAHDWELDQSAPELGNADILDSLDQKALEGLCRAREALVTIKHDDRKKQKSARCFYHWKDRWKKQKKRVEYFQELLALTPKAYPDLTWDISMTTGILHQKEKRLSCLVNLLTLA